MGSGPGESLSPWPSRLLEKIGEGDMGRVYRAWDHRLEGPVAARLNSEPQGKGFDLREGQRRLPGRPQDWAGPLQALGALLQSTALASVFSE